MTGASECISIQLLENNFDQGCIHRSKITLDRESEACFKNFPQQKPALLYKCS